MGQDSYTIYREVQKSRLLGMFLSVVIMDSAICVALYLFRYKIFGSPGWVADMTAMIAIVIIMAMSLGICVLFGLNRMITEVRTDGLYVRYIPLKPSFQQIPLTDVAELQVATYDPLKDYGGRGIKRGKDYTAYTVSGKRGVIIRYRNGKYAMIGSGNPEELAQAVQRLL